MSVEVNTVPVANIAKVDYVAAASIAAVCTVPIISAPPIPDLSGIAALYSSFGIAAGWQNLDVFVGTDVTDYASTALAPYPVNWPLIAADNPQVLAAWYDQSGGAFDAIAGAIKPDINTSTQRFTYDGTQNLVTPSGIISGDKLTIYCVFSTNSLAMAQTLLQSNYDESYLTDARATFAIYLTSAGVITVSQKTEDILAVFNTKIKTLGSTGLHLLTIVFDRSVSGAGATIAKLDNLTTGWTSAVSGTMTGSFNNRAIGIGLGKPLGTDAFLNGTFNECWVYNGAKDADHQTSVYDFLKYCYPEIP